MGTEFQYYYNLLEEIDNNNIEVTKWEADFIDNLLFNRPTNLTPKQIFIIDQMKERYLSH